MSVYDLRGSPVTRAEKRRWHRLVSGLYIGMHNDEHLRFMTLTTAPHCKKNINRSFDALKLRVWRTFGWKFNAYFKVKTAEGFGVLHILYRGRFIPQEWLSNAWREIHNGSYIVDIREIKKRYGSQRTANYLVSNYLQKNKIVRMSYGWRWLWLGFSRSWEHTKEVYGFIKRGGMGDFGKKEFVPFCLKYKSESLHVWRWRLREPLSTSRQIKLKRFMQKP